MCEVAQPSQHTWTGWNQNPFRLTNYPSYQFTKGALSTAKDHNSIFFMAITLFSSFSQERM